LLCDAARQIRRHVQQEGELIMSRWISMGILGMALGPIGCNAVAPAPTAASEPAVAGKADSVTDERCPGPYVYKEGAKFSFNGLKGTYVRSLWTGVKPQDLIYADFAPTSGPDQEKVSGLYQGVIFGQGYEVGTFQEAFSITVPAFGTSVAGSTPEQGRGYLTTKASIEADGTISRVCLQPLTSAPDATPPPFELVRLGL
jgi:hypothetical protein